MVMYFCLFLLWATINIFPPLESTCYKGSILFGQTAKLDAGDCFPVYYKGSFFDANPEKNNPSRLTFEFSDTISSFFILIIQTMPLPTCDKSETLKLPHSQKKFSLFKVRKRPTIDGKSNFSYEWVINEVTEDYIGAEVPTNSLIIFTDPSHIKNITSTSWNKNMTVVPLPIIHFQEELSLKSIKNIILKMQIALMDFKPFHTRQQITQKIIGNNCIIQAPEYTHIRDYLV